MNRFDFLGLNANQAACVLLYGIAVVWVLNFAAKRAYVKTALIVIEIALLVALGATLSRGGVVVLVCAAVYVWWLYRAGLRKWQVAQTAKSADSEAAGLKRDGKQTWQSALRWLSYSPLWRVALGCKRK